ncbi:MAG: lysoplasmalogenase family protein [Microbacteriaceae bacterium]
MNRFRVTRAFVPAIVVGVIHLGALVLDGAGVEGAGAVAGPTKLLLMPAVLLGLLWALPTVRVHIALWGGLGIFFSWLGDALLASPGGVGFLLGLGAFFLAHVFYLVLILRCLAIRRWGWVSLVYVVWWVTFVILLAPFAGSLFIPITLYGLVLGAMAACALRANPFVAGGAALFVVSDSILGLNLFVPGFATWQISVLIMFTYIAGQILIAVGAVVHARREGADAGAGSGAGSGGLAGSHH